MKITTIILCIVIVALIVWHDYLVYDRLKSIQRQLYRIEANVGYE